MAAQPKRFNTTGPCVLSDHYMLPALPRAPRIQTLVDHKDYFSLRAPRQSGKTTTIRAAVASLNQAGAHYALYCSLEKLRSVSNTRSAMGSLVGDLYGALRGSGVEALRLAAEDGFWDKMRRRPDFKAAPLRTLLVELSTRLDKELVLFFDEADSLRERPLSSFLSQLGNGYVERDTIPFPRSVALIGLRNIRDYKAKIRPDSDTPGSGGPFNILSEALTLPDFTRDEIGALYSQHARATGQLFEDEAVERAWYWSEGQPWLVNALAREVVEKISSNDYGRAVTAGHIDEAAGNLMKRRDTHVDSLLAKLHEPRVKRLIEPMLALSEIEAAPAENGESLDDDLQYSRYLGIVKLSGGPRPANPFYAGAVSRYINEDVSPLLPKSLEGKWMDGAAIDMTGLLKEFQIFWAERAERCLKGLRYKEAGPHSLLTAFLRRVVKGGAMIGEHYSLGLGFSDIVVKYAGRSYPIEMKMKENQRSLAESQNQLLGYMDRLSAKEGWLVLFDCETKKCREEKTTWETVTFPAGQVIHMAGC